MNHKQVRPVYLAMICCLLALIQCSHSENLSNVFVLDTSDSEPTLPPSPPTSSFNNNNKNNQVIGLVSSETIAKAKSYEDPANTKIITDEHSSSNSRNNQQHKLTQSTGDNVGRKLDETESQLHGSSSNNQAKYTNSRSNNPQQTTSRPKQSNFQGELPKTEDRLLITINHNDDEDVAVDSIRPQKQSSSSLVIPGPSYDSTSDNVHSTSNLQVPNNQNQKRKPSIVITVQEANLNKQNPGSSAVIVRPGEDGHSIVISTVQQSQSNKYNNNKPQNVETPPFREPINNPIQNILNQHQVTSTTRRPNYNNNNNNNNNDQYRPTNEETPHVPDHGLVNSYGSSQTRPPVNDYQESSNQESGQQSQQQGATKYQLSEQDCGRLRGTKIVGGDEADPSDYMWMAAIIDSKPKNGEPKPFCGGSLITRRHVLTAAHCLEGKMPRDVLVRLGSYDFDDSTASSVSYDLAIDQFRVPAQYSKQTHVADIAIMRLKTPLSTSDNYRTVCMPQPRRSYVGAYGTVTGYGSQSQTFRRAAPRLRQVTVPIWENRKCSTVYKKNLTESFLCAGYEEGGKDACQGDSGGPLMTEGHAQQMMVVGVVSHGIGCGTPGYPGVYTRTSSFLDWIEKNTRE